MLHGRDYNRDAILRQFPADSTITTNTISESAQESAQESAADSESAAESSESSPSPNNTSAPPQFIPLQSWQTAEIRHIALILPTLSDGIVGQVARNFYDGCLHAVQVSRRTPMINLYATDGGDMLSHYAAALSQGAELIIGPMLKKNVRQLLLEYPQMPTPTLLLQPGDDYFVMTLDAAQEAADLAQLFHARGDEILIVEQESERGARQSAAFSAEWLQLRGQLPQRIKIRDDEHDWAKLFLRLKDKAESDIAAISVAIALANTPPKLPHLSVFAAGDAAFAVRTRNFSPQRNVVVAVSTNNDGDKAALLVEDLAFMEMPWFVGDSSSDLSPVRRLSVLRQRFFVLGADACGAAVDFSQWQNDYNFVGQGGDWRLQQKTFRRSGKLSVYHAGQLQLLP